MQKISILGWKANNLRCPNMDISFNTSKKINFIQMPNGTGKTTLIKLIKNTLLNSWEDIDKFSDSNSSENCGEFQLDLSVKENTQTQKITFRVVLDFEASTAQYFTTTAETAEVPRFSPGKLQTYLTKGHINTFAFSGDNLKNYFPNDLGDQGARVGDVIESFTGIKKLKKLDSEINETFRNMNFGHLSDNSERFKRKINEIETALESKNEDLAKLKKVISDEEPVHERYKTSVGNWEKDNKDFKKKKEKLEGDIEEIKNEIMTYESKASEGIKNLYSISENIHKVSNKFLKELQKAKLPGAEKEFFVDLSELDKCVCGRPIGEEEKQNILDNSSNFLGSDDAGIINGIKTVNRIRIQDSDVNEYHSNLENLKTTLEDFKDLNEQLAQHEEDNKNMAPANIKKLIEKKEASKEKIDEAKKAMKRLIEGDTKESLAVVKKLQTKDIKTIAGLNAALVYYEDKLSKKLGIEQKLDCKESFLDCLERARTKSLSIINEEIKKDVNEKISSSHQDETFQIEKINSYLNISGGGGSGGQEVTAVTCFALSILQRSGVDFPLVIDHPVTPIQAESRPAISKMLNEICDQTICFVINTEKPGFSNEINDSNSILNAIKDDADLFTIYRTDRSNWQPSEEPSTTEFTSNNCIITKDAEFYNNFTLEDQSQ